MIRIAAVILQATNSGLADLLLGRSDTASAQRWCCFISPCCSFRRAVSSSRSGSRHSALLVLCSIWPRTIRTDIAQEPAPSPHPEQSLFPGLGAVAGVASLPAHRDADSADGAGRCRRRRADLHLDVHGVCRTRTLGSFCDCGAAVAPDCAGPQALLRPKRVLAAIGETYVKLAGRSYRIRNCAVLGISHFVPTRIVLERIGRRTYSGTISGQHVSADPNARHLCYGSSSTHDHGLPGALTLAGRKRWLTPIADEVNACSASIYEEQRCL